MLERTERLRPETRDRSTRLSELTPNSARIACVLVAISSARINKAVSKAVAATAAPRAASAPGKAR